MAFDPITFNEVLNSKAPIGSLVRVVDSFNNDRYVDTGSTFDISEYPQLGTQFAGGFQGDFVVENPLPMVPSGYSASASTLGSMVACFRTGTKINFLFARNVAPYSVYHYQTNTLSIQDGVRYIGTFDNPESTGAENWIPLFSSDSSNTYLFASWRGKHFRFDLADETLKTYNALSLVGENPTTRYSFAQGNNNTIVAMPDNLALGTAGNIQRSSDGGNTWVGAGAALNYTNSSRSDVVFGNNTFLIVAGSTTNNVARSTDGGATWIVTNAASMNNVKYSSALSLFVATPTASSAFQSSPDGVTWTARSANATSMQSRIAVTTTGGVLTTYESLSNTIFRSTSGTVWVQRNTSAPFNVTKNNPYLMALGCAGIDNQMFLITGADSSGTLFITSSSDDAATWSPVVVLPAANQTRRLRAPVVSSNGMNVVVMEQFGSPATSPALATWYGAASKDGGSTWQPINIPSNGDLVLWQDVVATHDNRFFAWGRIQQASQTLQTICSAVSSDGINWEYTNTNYNFSPTMVAIDKNNNIFLGSTSVTLGAYSTDMGKTWVSRGLPGTPVKLVSFKDKFIYFMGTSQAPRYITSDGATWTQGQMVTNNTLTISSFTCDDNVAVITCANSASFYYSYDGITWVAGTLPSPMPGPGVAIINGWIMISSGGGSMYRTKDFKAWEMVQIGEDSKYGTMAFDSIVSNPSNTTGFFHGAEVALTTGYALRAKTEVTNIRRVPTIPSDLSGTKWVIIAK